MSEDLTDYVTVSGEWASQLIDAWVRRELDEPPNLTPAEDGAA